MRALLIPLALPLLAGCHIPTVRFERLEQREIETTPLTAVSIDTFNGGIEVVPHDQPFVDLEITYRSHGSTEEEAEANCQELGCDIQAESGKLIIKATKPSNHWTSAASFRVKVPPQCDLTLHSSNGKLSAHDIQGSVEAHTSNGEIHFANITGQVSARTSNGKVHVEQVFGPVDIETSNGRVTYAGMPVGRDNRIRTSNGRVEIQLPQDAFVELHSRTSNGRVTCSLHPLEIFEQSKHKWAGLIGPSGGSSTADSEVPELTVRTSNGSITVQEFLLPGPEIDDQPSDESQPQDTILGEISDEIAI